MVVRCSLFACAVLLLSANTQSASLDKGVDAYLLKRPSVAISNWMPLAKRGDPKAQNNVGLLYQKGEAVPKNNQKAIEWYRKAVGQGLPEAHHNLGLLLYDQDPLSVSEEVISLFSYASKRNVSASTYMLGLIHYHGQSMQKDLALASKFWEIAAKEGNLEAQFMLAMLHQSGDLGPPRYDLAFIWSKIATDNGYQIASELNFFSTLKLATDSLPRLTAIADVCRSSRYTDCPD